MTSSISWKRILGEGVVIVASILLGLGIDAWWDNRQAARLEADILSALALEVARNQASLRSDAADVEAALELIDRFLLSEADSLANVHPDSVASWVRALAA
jgi:hypothetical protein